MCNSVVVWNSAKSSCVSHFYVQYSELPVNGEEVVSMSIFKSESSAVGKPSDHVRDGTTKGGVGSSPVQPRTPFLVHLCDRGLVGQMQALRAGLNSNPVHMPRPVYVLGDRRRERVTSFKNRIIEQAVFSDVGKN